MHGFAGEGQPAPNSLWSESEQPARSARSLAPSPALPVNAGQALGGEAGPFVLLAGFGGEPGGEEKGTSIKPEWGTCTFVHKASLRGWKLAQGEGLGHGGKGMLLNDNIKTSF